MLLIKAKAAGADISSVLSEVAVIAPNHRYAVLSTKAYELANEVKSLGNSLLSALEKQDVEGLSLLHSEQENTMLKAVRDLKTKQVKEAQEQINALVSGKEVVTHKHEYYSSREFMNGRKKAHQGLEDAALITQT